MEQPRADKPIWRVPPTVESVAAWLETNMISHLGIRLIEVGNDFLKATMPVDERTRQPMGILHGGASVVLAETLGSTAASLCIDLEKQYCVGLDINANHVRAVRSGTVTGIARPVHLGRRTQVWQIHIYNEQEKLVCLSRLTMAILNQE